MLLKKIFIFLLCFTFLLGCEQDHPDEKKEEAKIIAISLISETHGWPGGVWSYASEEVKRVANKNNWEYICVRGADSNEQSRQIIDLIEKEVDCIIMLPMDGASLKTAAKEVKKSGIPLVIFDREIPDFAPSATVKGDNAGIGIKTAEIFNHLFDSGTKVLEIMGDTSTVPFQRTAGYDETIHPTFSKIQLGYTGWQRNRSKFLFEKWVRTSTQEQINEVEAIFTHDDEIALGVLDVLDEYNQDHNSNKTFSNLKVIASSSGSQLIYQRILEEDEYYLFSLTYSPEMIKEAISVGEKIIKNETYKEMTIIPTQNVDQTNVEQYIDDASPF